MRRLRKHSSLACDKALGSGSQRLKDIRDSSWSSPPSPDFAFAQSHPLIRDLKSYSKFTNQQSPHRPNP